MPGGGAGGGRRGRLRSGRRHRTRARATTGWPRRGRRCASGPGVFIARLGASSTQGRPAVHGLLARSCARGRRQERRAVARTPPRGRCRPASRSDGMPSLATLGFDEPARELEDRPRAGRGGGPARARALGARRRRRATGAAQRARRRRRRDEPVPALRLPVPAAARAARPRRGGAGADVYRRELAWRDFYAYVLLHHPRIPRDAFRARDGRARVVRRRGRASRPGRRADRLSGRRRRHAPAARMRLDAQPGADDRRVVPRPRTCTSTGGSARRTSWST